MNPYLSHRNHLMKKMKKEKRAMVFWALGVPAVTIPLVISFVKRGLNEWVVYPEFSVLMFFAAFFVTSCAVMFLVPWILASAELIGMYEEELEIHAEIAADCLTPAEIAKARVEGLL